MTHKCSIPYIVTYLKMTQSKSQSFQAEMEICLRSIYVIQLLNTRTTIIYMTKDVSMAGGEN